MAGKFDSKYGRRKGDKGDGIHESDPDGGRYDLLSEEEEVLERFLIKHKKPISTKVNCKIWPIPQVNSSKLIFVPADIYLLFII